MNNGTRTLLPNLIQYNLGAVTNFELPQVNGQYVESNQERLYIPIIAVHAGVPAFTITFTPHNYESVYINSNGGWAPRVVVTDLTTNTIRYTFEEVHDNYRTLPGTVDISGNVSVTISSANGSNFGTNNGATSWRFSYSNNIDAPDRWVHYTNVVWDGNQVVDRDGIEALYLRNASIDNNPIASLVTSTTEPTSGSIGQFWFNPNTGQLRIYTE